MSIYRALLFILTLAVLTAPNAHACDCTSSTETPPTETETVVTIDYSNLQLSELYPYPAEGEEEYIELTNTGTVTLDISGLIINDAAQHTWTIPEHTSLEPYAYVAWPKSTTGIGLNNDTDTITIVDAAGTPLCSTTYENAEQGKAWAYINASWLWSDEPTMHTENILKNASLDTQYTNETTPDESTTIPETVEEIVEPSTAATPTTSDAVILSEILPNPSGSDATDEWIELYNTSSEPVTLIGWTLSDLSTTYSIPTTILEPESYYILESTMTGIALNNTGDTISLHDGTQALVSETTYEIAETDMAWSIINSLWQWSTPTPLSENIGIETEEIVTHETPMDSPSSEITSESTLMISIAEARTQALDTEVLVRGIVTATPQVFSAQYFYMQDDTAGIQIYSYAKDFPDLAEGDVIEVRGTLSSARNEQRLKIQSAEDVRIVSTNESPKPTHIEIASEKYEGMLVTLECTISTLSTSTFACQSGQTVAIKSSTDITAHAMQLHAPYSISGIISQYDDIYRLLPRSSIDVVAMIDNEPSFIPTAQASSGSTLTLTPVTHGRFPWDIYIVGASTTACLYLFIKKILRWRKHGFGRMRSSQELPILEDVPLTSSLSFDSEERSQHSLRVK